MIWYYCYCYGLDRMGWYRWDGIVYGMVLMWYGMVWYGMVWYGMVWYWVGMGWDEKVVWYVMVLIRDDIGVG